MKLSMLYVQSNKKYEALHKIKKPVIFQTHHITEIFMSFLPQIDLDGSQKIVILFQDKPEGYENRYICHKAFHVSEYYVDEFSLKQLNNLKPEDANMFFLDIIVEALSNIATESNARQEIIEIIKQTAEKVVNCNFELTLSINKLSKTYQKQYKAIVYRQLNKSGELWYVEIENLRSRNKVKYDIMKKPTHVSLVDYYKRSLWEEGGFIILDRLNNISATINANQIM